MSGEEKSLKIKPELKGPRFEELLKQLLQLDGTDLYLSVGLPPVINVNGQFQNACKAPLTPKELQTLISQVQRGRPFPQKTDIDLSYDFKGSERFRINIYRQRGLPAVVARRIHAHAPKANKLGLPKALIELSLAQHGLLLVTGAAGSGKSTSLAALIAHRNQNRDGHIVTLEDPIEFIHRHGRSVVSQRELGTDMPSFAVGLRSVLRQSPTVVVIGELRDQETARAVLHICETGHLVLTTFHATNSVHAIERFLAFFPNEQREQILTFLSQELLSICSQRLIPALDQKKRHAAFEILNMTPRISELIALGNFEELKNSLHNARGAEGLQSFEDSLIELLKKNVISMRSAIRHSDSPTNLRLRIRLEKGLDQQKQDIFPFRLL